jgi:hypothetical protein
MAVVTPRSARALLALGLRAVLHFVLFRWFAPRRLRGYTADCAAPVLADERAANARRCIGCGDCDGLFDEGAAPSLVLLQLGRESADARASLAASVRLRPRAEAISALCPEGVDVSALLDRIDRIGRIERTVRTSRPERP